MSRDDTSTDESDNGFHTHASNEQLKHNICVGVDEYIDGGAQEYDSLGALPGLVTSPELLEQLRLQRAECDRRSSNADLM